MAQKDTQGALNHYSEAARLYPEMAEIRFWQGVTLWTAGKEIEGMEILRPVLKYNPDLVELLKRLPAAKQLTERDLGRIMNAFYYDDPPVIQK